MDENTAIGVKEIPRMNIQWDWKEALRNPRGKAWISCKQENQPTIYGELVAHEEGDSIKIQATDGFEVKNVNRVRGMWFYRFLKMDQLTCKFLNS